MKPHITKRNGKWLVFRHASVKNFSLPVTGSDSLEEAWKKYLVYML